MKLFIKIFAGVYGFLLLVGCANDPDKKFRRIPSDESGIVFQNDLHETVEFNIFNYMYFYNGAGVAVGDVNNDELPDIYFASNQGSNKLYLNKGNLKFQDVTDAAGVKGSGGWATGVTMMDVNGDGRLDMYVSYIGDYLIFKERNQLFINEGLDGQGMPKFVDRASEYGLDLVGFSTQASFFDYDNDGDLDMFMLNHSLHQNGTFGKAGTLRHQTHPTAGDKLLKNENGKYIEVTKEAGIYSSVLGYGLGVVVSDVNLDGWLDIFVGNDFHENDYLYINKGDGTFEERLENSMNHTSRYTMGVDFADFNNDAYPDLISMDMLPSDYQRLKASAAEDAFDVYDFKTSLGYNEQYTRNALQLNNHDGTFSEIGLFAGVAATDWSWATLFADFDLDGDKDIFVSNGILRRSNDLDYINFIEVDSIQATMKKETGKELRYIQQMPKVKVQNFLFVNNNDSTFTNKASEWGMDEPSYSNGAAYADFDNDGDLDLITNNVDDAAFLYENRTINLSDKKNTPSVNFLQVKLEGQKSNINGIGAKVFLYTNGNLQMQECMPTRGFQSSVDVRLTFGTGKQEKIDSVWVVWSNGYFQKLIDVKANQKITLKQADALVRFDYHIFSPGTKVFQDATDSFSLPYKHRENHFIEFVRDGLVPFMLSAEGPAAAVGDINNDGLNDVYLSGGKRQASQTYIQTSDGKFVKMGQPLLEADSVYEYVSAVFFDADNDKDQDLFLVSGGNEFYGKSKYMRPQLYLNNGRGEFTQYGKLPELFLNGSCAKVSDLDQDGDMDIFVGARTIPWKYGIAPDSYILVNDGKGNFTNATAQLAPELMEFGFVKDATWADIDNDGDNDLLVAAEWKPISVFFNEAGKLRLSKDNGLENAMGWWNTIATGDFDQDGDLDIVAGNLGLNSKLKADSLFPVKMYVNDFDKNDSIEQLLTYRVNGVEYPVNTRDEMTKQIPSLKKKYLSYHKFSLAEFDEFFPSDVIQKSRAYEANDFESVYIENKGNNRFEIRALPKVVQFSTVNAFLVQDFNNDGHLDILAGGNFFRSNIQMGRYDASFGQLLEGDGKGNFKAIPAFKSGFSVRGETRRILPVKISNRVYYMVVRNNDSVKFFTLNEKTL